MEKEIKFDIAYNFEDGLMEQLAAIGNVHGVYAKLKSDMVGGGRASLGQPDIDHKTLAYHIELARKNNINFNYLLNSMCMSNNELKKDYHLQLAEFIKELDSYGVNSVTVANPFLCDFIKNHFPDLEVCLSVNLTVKSLQQVKYWEDFGIDEITLDQVVNRNFGLLKEILRHTKKTGTRIRLFANNLCLHDCPLRAHHGLANSHASQKESEDMHLHYYYYKCTAMKMKDISKLISATWIRPDDLVYYENLMDEVDNHNMTLKLTERNATTAYLTNTLKAYKNKHYEGNLMDIMYAIQKKFMLGNKSTVNSSSYKKESLDKLNQLFELDWLYIDNRKLDGFLDHFVNHYQCDKKVCTGDEEENGPESCKYCLSWAKKAITCDEEMKSNYTNNLESFLDDFVSSKIFK